MDFMIFAQELLFIYTATYSKPIIYVHVSNDDGRCRWLFIIVVVVAVEIDFGGEFEKKRIAISIWNYEK